MVDVHIYVSLVKDRSINVLVQHMVDWPSLQMEKLVKVLQYLEMNFIFLHYIDVKTPANHSHTE